MEMDLTTPQINTNAHTHTSREGRQVGRFVRKLGLGTNGIGKGKVWVVKEEGNLGAVAGCLEKLNLPQQGQKAKEHGR